LPDNHLIANVRFQGKTIASILVREFKNTAYPTVGYALKKYRTMNPINLLYWNLMEEGCQKGLGWIDFGRSIKDSGSYQF